MSCHIDNWLAGLEYNALEAEPEWSAVCASRKPTLAIYQWVNVPATTVTFTYCPEITLAETWLLPSPDPICDIFELSWHSFPL